MKYRDQLKDVRWLDKRAEIIARDYHKCTQCGYKKTLQVHHVSYSRGRMAWDYPDDQLVTLCKSCHAEIEDDREQLHRALTFADLWAIHDFTKQVEYIAKDFGPEYLCAAITIGRTVLSETYNGFKQE